MAVFQILPCSICKKEDGRRYVYLEDMGIPIGDKCWDIATRFNQLNLTEVLEEIKSATVSKREVLELQARALKIAIKMSKKRLV